MFDGFFGWLRGQVKNAVLGGVEDAMQELDQQQYVPKDEVTLALQSRMQALPAPSTNGKVKKSKD